MLSSQVDQYGVSNRDRRDPARLAQIIGDLLVIHRLIHADIERLLARVGVIQRHNHALDKVAHVDEVSFHGAPLGSSISGTVRALRYSSAVSAGTSSRHRGPPKTSSPNVSEYLKSSFSMIHGARRQHPVRSY